MILFTTGAIFMDNTIVFNSRNKDYYKIHLYCCSEFYVEEYIYQKFYKSGLPYFCG